MRKIKTFRNCILVFLILFSNVYLIFNYADAAPAVKWEYKIVEVGRLMGSVAPVETATSIKMAKKDENSFR